MNSLQKPLLLLTRKIRAGGGDYAPPTVCLLPACASAYVAARVERTGGAETKKSGGIDVVGRSREIEPFWRAGLRI